MIKATKKTKKVHIKSALPIFAAAGVFVLGALIFPIYKLWAIILTAALSGAAYLALDMLVFKGRDAELVTEEFTGDKDLDALIKNGVEIIARFRSMAEGEKDTRVAACLNRIAASTEGIIDDVINDPEDRSDSYTFFSYYLPTIDKLMRYYEQLKTNSHAENASASKARIENCLEMIADAFEKFLDKLYRSEAAEIKTSIEVLKIMLRSDGLTDKESAQKVNSTDISAYSASQMDADIETITGRLRDEAELEKKQAAATH